MIRVSDNSGMDRSTRFASDRRGIAERLGQPTLLCNKVYRMRAFTDAGRTNGESDADTLEMLSKSRH
jgi:hypothetical protein